MITLSSKQDEYDLMVNSPKIKVEVQVPEGPKLVMHNCWDYSTDLKQTTFKSPAPPSITHVYIKVTEVDLNPVSAKKFWVITVPRYVGPRS